MRHGMIMWFTRKSFTCHKWDTHCISNTIHMYVQTTHVSMCKQMEVRMSGLHTGRTIRAMSIFHFLSIPILPAYSVFISQLVKNNLFQLSEFFRQKTTINKKNTGTIDAWLFNRYAIWAQT